MGRHTRHHAQKGFTLVELLTSIAIIGLLGSTVIASTNISRMKSRDSYRQVATLNMMSALEFYRSQYGHFPCYGNYDSKEPGYFSSLQPLVDAGYLSSIPKDPLNDGDYVFWYVSLTDLQTDQCGSYFLFSYNVEVPGSSCVNGKFSPTIPVHCHVTIAPFPCDDPYDTQYDGALSPNCQTVVKFD